MIKKIIFFYYHQNRFSFYSVLITLALIFITFLFYLIYFANLPSKLPIFYSHSWGEEQLASREQFIILPLIVILITMINLIVSWHLHSTQILLKKIINFVTILVALLILVTSLQIIYIYI